MRFKWGYLWVTSGLFLISLIGHWLFAWFDYVHEADAHGQPVEISSYLIDTGKAMLENWQSEFLQLLWQVVGLAYFLYLGSPSSKENDDRLEAKVDELLRQQLGSEAEARIAEIDREYLRHHGHAMPVGAKTGQRNA